MQLEMVAGTNVSFTIVPGTATTAPKFIISAGTAAIQAPVQALAAMTLTSAQNDKVFTSQGATGDRSTRVINLPAEADAPAGLEYSFNTYETEGLRIQAPAGAEILLGDDLISAVGGYIETVTANQWLRLYKLAANVWTCRAYTAGWVVSE